MDKSEEVTLCQRTRDWINRGPFRDQFDDFLRYQVSRGYALTTVKWHAYSVIHFGDWLQEQALDIADVTPDHLKLFREGRHDRWTLSGAAIRTIVEMALGRGLKPRPEEDSEFQRQASECLLNFSRYLRNERGLEEVTTRRYVALVRTFLTTLKQGAEGLDLGSLTGAETSQFLLGYAGSWSPGQAKLMVVALRAFFRHLTALGLVSQDLSERIPTVPNWKLQVIPKALTGEEVQRLLASCDRDKPGGIRDYAILLTMARLGLRPGEVAHMELGDLDWEAGELSVSGKSARLHRLPIPEDVGQAIAHYLRDVRHSNISRRVFVRLRAPFVGFRGAGGVSDVVRRAMARVGLNPPRKGGHTLRHTVACQMLRNGGTLCEIGRLLRHQSPQTTEIYAKVDLQSLRALAMPWPGGVR